MKFDQNLSGSATLLALGMVVGETDTQVAVRMKSWEIFRAPSSALHNLVRAKYMTNFENHNRPLHAFFLFVP